MIDQLRHQIVNDQNVVAVLIVVHSQMADVQRYFHGNISIRGHTNDVKFGRSMPRVADRFVRPIDSATDRFATRSNCKYFLVDRMEIGDLFQVADVNGKNVRLEGGGSRV